MVVRFCTEDAWPVLKWPSARCSFAPFEVDPTDWSPLSEPKFVAPPPARLSEISSTVGALVTTVDGVRSNESAMKVGVSVPNVRKEYIIINYAQYFGLAVCVM